jgi:hypothetical protein
MFAHKFRIQCCASGGRSLGTQQRCASSLVCWLCRGSGRGESRVTLCQVHGAHARGDGISPAFLDERAIEEIRNTEGLSFPGARKEVPRKKKRKSGAHAYALTLRRLRAIDATTETTAFHIDHSPLPLLVTLCIQPIFSAQTEGLALTYQPPAHDARPSRSVHPKSPFTLLQWFWNPLP